MRVFVTGASGFIGRAVVAELVEAGHEVAGMVRSPASADVVAALGATPSMGDLDDLDAIRAGAADADAVVHLANKHDWVNWAESNRAERAETRFRHRFGELDPQDLVGAVPFDQRRQIAVKHQPPEIDHEHALRQRRHVVKQAE